MPPTAQAGHACGQQRRIDPAIAHTQRGDQTTDPNHPPGPNGRHRSWKPATSPNGDEDESAPSARNLRTRLAGAARALRGTLRSIRQVLGLVWGTSRLLTVGMAAVTLVQSLLPAAQVWLAGLLIQSVADGIAAPAAGRA
ncbi:MAG TPA: hypothetical protein VFQ80_13060, partial [Thermomicrobiales bacterium]|nr:hypothetical protein [Thermomicrobiales bacterium]